MRASSFSLRHFKHKLPLGMAASVLLLSACAQTPMGPTVNVMPGPGKAFDAFQFDQAGCKQFAEQAVAGQAQEANLKGVGAAALTTALGAGLGAAIGGGRGAGIGAASGALGGAGIGAMTSGNQQNDIQSQYNNAFAQCMYAKGNLVPGFAPAAAASQTVPAYNESNLTFAVQQQLRRLGYLRTAPDGVLGPATTSAIVRYEQVTGMPVDGVPSPALLARLQSTP